MTKDELINELDQLANKNIKSHPGVSGILYTLGGLVALDLENLLAIKAREINEYMLNNFNNKLNQLKVNED